MPKTFLLWVICIAGFLLAYNAHDLAWSNVGSFAGDPDHTKWAIREKVFLYSGLIIFAAAVSRLTGFAVAGQTEDI